MNATGNPRLQGGEEVNPTAATQLSGEPWAHDYDKLDVEAAYLARQATVCRLPMVYGERDYQRREEPILRRVRAGRSHVPVGAGSWLFTRGYETDPHQALAASVAWHLANPPEGAGGDVSDDDRALDAATG
jgi:nucleoside-diphosphate-sugar epimerase